MTPETEQTPEPKPAALRRRNQILAVLAIVLAAAVPAAFAFGVDVCTPLAAVGVTLDACKAEPPLPPAAAPSPAAPGDAGAR